MRIPPIWFGETVESAPAFINRSATFSSINPQSVHHVGVGGIADHIEHLPVQAAFIVHNSLDVLFVHFDHDIRSMGACHLFNCMPASVAHAADDVMVC